MIKLLNSLFVDFSLVLSLILVACAISIAQIYACQGLPGFQLLSFTFMKDFFIAPISFARLITDLGGYLMALLVIAIPLALLTLGSWLCSELAFLLKNRIDLPNIFLVSICFFVCTVSFMVYDNIPYISDKEKNQEYYYPFSWNGLDSVFTPAAIVTSFLMLGMFITYYHHN